MAGFLFFAPRALTGKALAQERVEELDIVAPLVNATIKVVEKFRRGDLPGSEKMVMDTYDYAISDRFTTKIFKLQVISLSLPHSLSLSLLFLSSFLVFPFSLFSFFKTVFWTFSF